MSFVGAFLGRVITGVAAGATFALGNLVITEAAKRAGLITPSKIESVTPSSGVTTQPSPDL